MFNSIKQLFLGLQLGNQTLAHPLVALDEAAEIISMAMLFFLESTSLPAAHYEPGTICMTSMMTPAQLCIPCQPSSMIIKIKKVFSFFNPLVHHEFQSPVVLEALIKYLVVVMMIMMMMMMMTSGTSSVSLVEELAHTQRTLSRAQRKEEKYIKLLIW